MAWQGSVPSGPERICAGSCGTTIQARVGGDRCPACARQVEQMRGSASARGYGSAWARWRLIYISTLVRLGIAPVCGATMPDGPQTTHSACKAAGLMTGLSSNGEGLHLNHEPPLRDEERRVVHLVCDSRRIELLCAACHGALAPSTWL